MAIKSSEGLPLSRAKQHSRRVHYLNSGIPGISGGSVAAIVLLVLGLCALQQPLRVVAIEDATEAALPQLLPRKAIYGWLHDCRRSSEQIHGAPHACGGAQREAFSPADKI